MTELLDKIEDLLQHESLTIYESELLAEFSNKIYKAISYESK